MTDLGPPPDELLPIVREAGCKLVLSERLSDGTTAHTVHCPTHAHKVRLLANLARWDARQPEVIRVAQRIRASVGPEPAELAAAVQRYVLDRVQFAAESREVFTPTLRTLQLGGGDCAQGARAVMALADAAGLPAGLRTIGSPPRHVAAVIQLGGAWRWAETSVQAELGEHPLAAAQRLGLRLDPRLAADLGQATEQPPPTHQRWVRNSVVLTMGVWAGVGAGGAILTQLVRGDTPELGATLTTAVASSTTAMILLAVAEHMRREPERA